MPELSDQCSILSVGPLESDTHLLLAHGAGAAMTSPFMERIAALLCAQGLAVHRFEFPYMAARRSGASKRPPPKAETLTGAYEAAVAAVRQRIGVGPRLLIGGKSMGGRVASLVADRLYAREDVAGLVCLGYPFHPIGKPETLRTAHLEHLQCPAQIVQGTRDPFGTREEVAGYGLSSKITVTWIENGDHDFKGAGRGVMERVADDVATFARRV